MAQASIAATPKALGPLGSASQLAALTADELREVREYEKIVQFRDSILAGQHPRIKLPTQAAARSQSNLQSVELEPALVDRRLDNLESFKANSQQTGAAVSVIGNSSMSTSTVKPFGLGATQIDPLLLTKSDELIRAELQLQRQRLERSLRDQFEQHRAAKKAEGQFSEPPNAFDIPDILAKALTLVQATAPPPTTNSNMAANASESSDSFDENTFYSSQHDTPEPHISPPAHNTPEDTLMRDAPSLAVQLNSSTSQPRPASTLYDNRNLASVQNNTPFIGGTGVAGYVAPGQHGVASYTYRSDRSVAEQVHLRDDVHLQVNSSNGSGTTSRTGESGTTESDHQVEHARQLLPGISNSFGHRNPPFVRGHDLSPLAPQPTHVSPIATARQPPMPDPDITILPGAPAQVAALRQETANGTSPDSSPQGDKGGKRKNKKKKRKAAEGRTTGPTSPLIKPEPRSPSPVVAPPYARPHKRQRHSNRPQQDLSYEEARGSQPVGDVHQEEYEVRPLHRETVPVGYLRSDDPYASLPATIDSGRQRYERPVYEDRRPVEPIQYIRRAPSPSSYTMRYAPGETRSIRSATYSVADPIFRDGSTYHPEGRSSVRPVVERARSRSPVVLDTRPSIMGPPRQPPPRIVRDQFGREYLEPAPPPTISQRSAVPIPPPAEQEMIYERAPIRATSRMPAADTFERDGIIYRRVSPVPAPRRVITQPDYASVEYRSYRDRDYPAQPLPPPIPGREYIQYRGPTETQLPGEVAREYTARAVSVRPSESVRYDYGRVQSMRPDLPPREYMAGIHPEARREVAPQVYRDFSGRPGEQESARREFSTRPPERYYDGQPRREEEGGYIEPPRTVQHEVVYDDGRREAYR